jgi:hypothetical protein
VKESAFLADSSPHQIGNPGPKKMARAVEPHRHEVGQARTGTAGKLRCKPGSIPGWCRVSECRCRGDGAVVKLEVEELAELAAVMNEVAWPDDEPEYAYLRHQLLLA